MDRITIETPLGKMLIEAGHEAIRGIHYDSVERIQEGVQSPVLLEAEIQIKEYFSGVRSQFDVPVLHEGTTFQQLVWNATAEIPYGETRSYKQIATTIDRPTAGRAVASALNRNKIPIIVPCHRVIGSDGSLVGYNGGLERKKMLLALEQKNILRD